MPRIAYGKPAAAGMTIQETKKLVDDYANEMKDISGNHMNVKDLAEYMGCHRETAEKELQKAKVPFVQVGRLKRYRTAHIAKMLVEHMVKV